MITIDIQQPVIDKPEVLSSPKTSLVSLGSQTTIHCKIEDLSNIEEEYHWSRDSNEVVESDRVFMYSNGSLHISNFTVSDLGYYDCTVTLTIASNAANPLRYAVGGAFITEGWYEELKCISTYNTTTMILAVLLQL